MTVSPPRRNKALGFLRDIAPLGQEIALRENTKTRTQGLALAKREFNSKMAA
jgi:hypothetical protein